MPRARALATIAVFIATSILTVGLAEAAPAGGTRSTVHVVEMVHDSAGQHFAPSTVRARSGDTVRFVNREGHHNVDFVRDSNPPGVRLPAATPIAERSGEVVDVPIALPPGRYYFQCDPHVAMKMVGHLIVTGRKG